MRVIRDWVEKASWWVRQPSFWFNLAALISAIVGIVSLPYYWRQIEGRYSPMFVNRGLRAAFNAPTRIDLDESKGIQLLLSPMLSAEDLVELIEEEGDVKVRTVRYAPLMHAALEGSAFTIKTLTPATQVLDTLGVTEWGWEIVPTSPGPRQRLTLTISIVVRADGADRMHTVRVLREHIDVRVPAGKRISGFVERNWQWLCATILLPLGGWFWNRRRKRPRGKKSRKK